MFLNYQEEIKLFRKLKRVWEAKNVEVEKGISLEYHKAKNDKNTSR